MSPEAFLQLLRQKGEELYRPMPWRINTSLYFVLVSELMLQQTQVSRVLQKFPNFVEHFPDFETLANAPLSQVLTEWVGLGYNRRAKFLHESAKTVVGRYQAVLPNTLTELTSLPGVGVNTAGAILAYVFNAPAVFIETNIRTVLIHHFFKSSKDQEKVSDVELRELLARLVDQSNPRQFYYAMMDYGSWLKSQKAVRINRSSSYKKQPALKGSLRETRGLIIKKLAENSGRLTPESLATLVGQPDRFDKALISLQTDGLVMVEASEVSLRQFF